MRKIALVALIVVALMASAVVTFPATEIRQIGPYVDHGLGVSGDLRLGNTCVVSAGGRTYCGLNASHLSFFADNTVSLELLYQLALASDNGVNGYFLRSNGDNTFTWATPAGTGDFSGPASSTDNALVIFNGTGGKTGKNSPCTVRTDNVLTCPEGFSATQSATAAGYVRLYELSGNGTNYIHMTAPDNIAMNRQIPSSYSKCTTIDNVVDTSDYPLEKFPYAVTITNIKVYSIGDNVVGGLDECTGTNGVCSTLTAVDADITAADGVEASDDGSLTNGGIASGNWIRWHTTSHTGTNTSTSICFFYIVADGFSLPIVDNFNRANANPLNGDWEQITGYNAMQILDNTVQLVTQNAWAGYNRPAAEAWPNDQYSQVTISLVVNAWRGLQVRATDNTFYAVHWDQNSYYIYRVNSGTETQLGLSGSWAVQQVVGDIIKFSITGTTMTLWKNGAAITTRTDNTIASGVPGFGAYAGTPYNAAMDDWTGGAP